MIQSRSLARPFCDINIDDEIRFLSINIFCICTRKITVLSTNTTCYRYPLISKNTITKLVRCGNISIQFFTNNVSLNTKDSVSTYAAVMKEMFVNKAIPTNLTNTRVCMLLKLKIQLSSFFNVLYIMCNFNLLL